MLIIESYEISSTPFTPEKLLGGREGVEGWRRLRLVKGSDIVSEAHEERVYPRVVWCGGRVGGSVR